MTWTEKDDIYTTKSGEHRLKAWQSAQFRSWGWSITKGYMLKAGDTSTLEGAQQDAEAALKTLAKR